jgi:hypothetical protein
MHVCYLRGGLHDPGQKGPGSRSSVFLPARTTANRPNRERAAIPVDFVSCWDETVPKGSRVGNARRHPRLTTTFNSDNATVHRRAYLSGPGGLDESEQGANRPQPRLVMQPDTDHVGADDTPPHVFL